MAVTPIFASRFAVMSLFAQGILEFSRASSQSLSDSLKEAFSNFEDGLRDIDQQTWLIIAGVLIVLWFFTRRRRR